MSAASTELASLLPHGVMPELLSMSSLADHCAFEAIGWLSGLSLAEASANTCIFVGCTVNMYSLETINKRMRDGNVKNANVMNTFAQFVSALVFSYCLSIYVSFVESGGKLCLIPFYGQSTLWDWLVIGTFVFLTTILTNLSMDKGVPAPTMNIFKSLNLLVNLTVSCSLFGEPFSIPKLIGVVLISIGVIAISREDRGSSAPKPNQPVPPYRERGSRYDLLLGDEGTIPQRRCGYCKNHLERLCFLIKDVYTNRPAYLPDFYFGILLLVISLFTAAFQSNFQKRNSTKYTKLHWSSVVFYSHIAPTIYMLICFHTELAELGRQYHRMHSAPPPVIEKSTPYIQRTTPYTHLLLYAASQTWCIAGVYMKLDSSTPMQLNLALTIRKFMNTAISVLFNDYPMTPLKFLSIILVILGTLLFFTKQDAFDRMCRFLNPFDDTNTASIRSKGWAAQSGDVYRKVWTSAVVFAIFCLIAHFAYGNYKDTGSGRFNSSSRTSSRVKEEAS